MEVNPFKVDFNLKSGMVEVSDNVPDGTVRFPCLPEEARELVGQWQAAVAKADVFLKGPLLNVQQMNEAVEKAKSIPRGETPHPAHVMLDYYTSSLQLFSDIAAADRRNDYSALKTCLEIVDVMLAKHKHHLPESGLTRDPFNPNRG